MPKKKRPKKQRQKATTSTPATTDGVPELLAWWTKLKAWVLSKKVGVLVVVAIVVGREFVGQVSDCGGFVQTVQALNPPPPPPPVKALMVSPSFKAVEGLRGDVRFPLVVTNRSTHEVSGEVLRVEVRPPARVLLETDEHPDQILAKSPNGTGSVFVDPNVQKSWRVGDTVLLFVPLSTLPPNESHKFEAVVTAQPGQTIQLTSTTILRSEVSSLFPQLTVATSPENVEGKSFSIWVPDVEDDAGRP